MVKVPQSGRRALSLVARVLVGAAALVLGAAAALALVFPPERLTPLARAELSRLLDAPVSLRRAEVRLLPLLVLSLDDIVIGDPRGYVRPKAWPRGGVAGAKRAEASIAFLPLFSRRLEIHGVRFEDAAVTLVRNEAGLGNWEGLGGPRRAPTPAAARTFDLELRRLDLVRARLRFYDARDGMNLGVRRLDAAFSATSTSGGKGRRFRLLAQLVGVGGRAAWPLGERPIRLDADVESQAAGERWLLKKVALSRGRLLLSGAGTVEGAEQVLAFTLDQGSVPLADLLELLPADQVQSLGRLGGTGTVALAATVSGPLSRGRTPAVKARAVLAGGRLAFRDRALALEEFAFDLTATERGADVARASGRVGRSTFEASGLARDWADPRLRAKIRAAVDLADVARFLPLADSTRLSGRARVDLDGAGRAGSAADFGWSGHVDLADVAASGIGLARPLEGIAGSIGLSPGRAWATGLTARIGASDLTVDGTIERPIEWITAAAGGAPAPAVAIARLAVRSRNLDVDALLPPTRSARAMPPVRAEGTFEVGRLKAARIDATRARGRFVYGHGVTSIEECAFDAYGGRARGRAWFDLRDPAKPRYQVHATAESLDANQVVSSWTEAKNIAFGTLQMTLDLDGAGLTAADVTRSLTVKGLAQVLGGRLAGSNVFARLAQFTGVDRFRILSFRDLSAPFRVVQGRVIFDPLALSSGETDWLAQGSVGLDGTLDFAVAASVPAAQAAMLPPALARTAGALLESDGRLTLDLALSGSVTAPRFAWDSRRTASRLFERTIDEVAKQAGIDLGDSLGVSRASIEQKADAMVEEQKRRMAEELERRRREAEARALEELAKLFEKKAPPPPPAPDTTATPGAPADSVAAPPAPPDTAAAPADSS